MKPVHFQTAGEFRQWLEQNHTRATELWVAFYKKSSGKPGMTYAEAVDEALCFGWIDGIIKRIDAERFMHRFSPRKPRSIWSNVNVGHATRLIAAGRMRPAGLAAFTARETSRTGLYSFEQRERPMRLPAAYERLFRANRQAWAFFEAQPPSYRRLVIFKVVNPKQPATRERWLARFIAWSAAGKRFDPMARLTGQ
jgi:uncharacterized protein YdeI (YjbR/CyaY-like superfamily)